MNALSIHVKTEEPATMLLGNTYALVPVAGSGKNAIVRSNTAVL